MPKTDVNKFCEVVERGLSSPPDQIMRNWRIPPRVSWSTWSSATTWVGGRSLGSASIPAFARLGPSAHAPKPASWTFAHARCRQCRGAPRKRAGSQRSYTEALRSEAKLKTEEAPSSWIQVKGQSRASLGP